MTKPVVAIASLFTATTADATATIPITDTRGNAFTLCSTCFVNNKRTTIPSTIGMRTIRTIEKNILLAETGSYILANYRVKVGVRTGAKIVETAVIVTDKAVFPFAKYVMTFDAVPPGAHPTKITPTATSGDSLNRCANPKAIKGMIVY